MAMTASNCVFVGIKGCVVALDRASGTVLWRTELAGSEFVNVVGSFSAVLASTNGEVFCLDPISGEIKRHNPLKGLGRGLASIMVPGLPVSAQLLMTAKRAQDQQVTAAATASSSASSIT